MILFTHRTILLMNGLIWLTVGVFLLRMGIRFTLLRTDLIDYVPWVTGLALLIGYLKGRVFLSRTAQRLISRLYTTKSPTQPFALYDRKYAILLLAMLAIGFSFSVFQIPSLFRGGVDIAVGAALIHGSLTYFRELSSLRKSQL